MSAAHVLLVDDNDTNRLLTRAQLEHAGYDVTEAANGHEALDRIDRSPIDLVLLDVMMPGIDGFETCRRMRSMPVGEKVPIVFLTALDDRETHTQALDSGADDFLTKPINKTELLLRVRSLLRITKLHEELRLERDELLRLQRQKALLSDLVIHDLKNPLSSIIANGDYVLAAPALAGDYRDAVADVISSAETMHQMVLNLLDISRADDGELTPHPAPVDVRSMLATLQRRLRHRAEEREHRLKVNVEGIECIEADESLLFRTLENLVDNCLKYTPPKGAIEVAAKGDAQFFELTVSDEGNGIPPEQRSRIFEKYGRCTSSHERTSRGLGLVFCRLAVEAHGGRIWVEDRKPRGSVFRIRIPRGRVSGAFLRPHATPTKSSATG